MLTRFLFTFLLIISFGIQASQTQLDKAKACYESKDYECALSEFMPLANQGDPSAQYNLGLMFRNGEGVARNYTEAMKWYLKAAEQSSYKAQYNLGFMYLEGEGVAKNDIEAMKWYRKAAEQEYADAQHMLGYMYNFGKGVAKNDVEAMEWYRKAADQGDAHSHFTLGSMYLDGEGVAQDYAEAVKWYRKAAELGSEIAQVDLAEMYYKGEGVARNYTEAMKWYLKAAEQGSYKAQFYLGIMYNLGKGVAQDYAEAMKWYRKAAEQGYAKAQFNLGYMYHYAEGVAQDFAEAMKWYRKAEKQNLSRAISQISAIETCKSASTSLFDETLLCAKRANLRAAIKGAGAKVTREKDNYFADLYNSSTVLKESSELAVYYVDSAFASAQYTFPSHVDPDQIVRIRNMVASKYGQPYGANGKVSLGPASFFWILEDGIELKVSRGWPDTTTYLIFTEPETNESLQERLAELEAESKQKEYSAQSNAF